MSNQTTENFSLLNEHPLSKYNYLHNASWDEIRKVQNELFLDHLSYAAANSPYYKEYYRAYDIPFHMVKNLMDIDELPFTDKNEMTGQNYNFRASLDSDICDISFTSAVTGKTPTMMMMTHSDMARLAYSSECAYRNAGVTQQDTVLLCAVTEKCYLGGIGSYLGGLRTGARMVRCGVQDVAYIWNLIQSVGPSVVVAAPSLMLKVAEFAARLGKDPSYAGIKKIIAITEAVRDFKLDPLPLTEKLEALWESSIYSSYFSSELAASFCECQFRQGVHINPELALVEILDEHNRPVRDGDAGELVITPFGIKGTPLIRFRTGDITCLRTEKCFCGQTTPRLGPILGRKKQAITLKGVKLFPNTILAVLEGMDYFYGGYIEVKRSFDNSDAVTLFIALNDSTDIESIRGDIEKHIKVAPNIITVSKAEIDKRLLGGRNRHSHTSFFDLR
ncbi:MAG: AMP-binding protein [Candidatus Izemoplasmatales bacterium]|nr:AMP-binding protein [Candidatus Izemoplasmatales bacterium]